MPRQDEATREMSSSVFGNRAFAAVASSVDVLLHGHREGSATARQVAAATGLADSVVKPVLLRLVEAGLLRPLPRISSRGVQLYVDPGSSGWVQLMSTVRWVNGETSALEREPGTTTASIDAATRK